MNIEDKIGFAKLMLGVFEYYGREPSESLVDIYWNGLQSHGLSEVKQAFTRHMKSPDSGQYMPKIGDIEKMLAGTSQDKGLSAWSKVDKALRMVGPYQDVCFDDPIIHRVLSDMGGWIQLGSKTEEEWPFIANEFENRYKGYAMRSEVPEYPNKLTGIANAENQSNGKKINHPVLIGNQEKAKMVLLNGKTDYLLNTSSTFKRIGLIGVISQNLDDK